MYDQTIWLSPKATAFTAVCAECADEHGFIRAHVRGRLELGRVHGSTMCGRGHPIRIERAFKQSGRERMGVLSA